MGSPTKSATEKPEEFRAVLKSDEPLRFRGAFSPISITPDIVRR